jgi:hypothetical protein
MKELDAVREQILQGTEIVAEQEKKKQVVLSKRERAIPGLTLWEYNYNTGVLRKAKFEKQDILVQTLQLKNNWENPVHKKVSAGESSFHLQALNRKNAIRKLQNLGFKTFKDELV